MINNFDIYKGHYARMDNSPPNWDVAEEKPEEFACTRPWLPVRTDARILDFGCGYSLMQILVQAGFVEHRLVSPDWGFDLHAQTRG